MSAKATVKRYLTRLREIPRMTVKRYLMFLLGVLVCATGIAFITRAALGTSPHLQHPLRAQPHHAPVHGRVHLPLQYALFGG